MAKSSEAVSALEYLAKPNQFEARPVNAVFGDEPFLKRLIVEALRNSVLQGEDTEFATTNISGTVAAWRDVVDELSTGALFGGGQRVVIVDDADTMVSEYRSQIESYVEKPSTSGVLILSVSTWPKTTRLFKALAKVGLQINCGKPNEPSLIKWLQQRAQSTYNCRLPVDAANELLETIGPELGLLEQELDKLSLAAGPDAEITPALVREMVGSWRTKTVWVMLDAAYDGNAAEALQQLERLIHAGESPVMIFAQISSSLRRLAAATSILTQNERSGIQISLLQALEQAGTKGFVLKKTEGQLRRVGRVRALSLYQWLIEADLALKGSSSSPPRARLLLEQLIVRIAAPFDQFDKEGRVVRHLMPVSSFGG